MGSRAFLIVVDDDEYVRRAAERLLRLHGNEVCTFASAEAYLADGGRDADCLIVDVDLAGISGLELEAQLRERGVHSPIVFITSHHTGDIVDALRRNGRRFMTKPLDERALLAAIAAAMRPAQ